MESIYQYSFSFSCGIPDADDNSYIITGGVQEEKESTLVSKYSEQGWIKDLPELNQGRERHGCGTYVDSNENKVNITEYKCSMFQIFRFIL